MRQGLVYRACGHPVVSHLLVHKAVPVGLGAQYDVEHVCADHMSSYRARIHQGLVEVLTEEEAVVAEVMLS
jgi:hypothetical protein